MQEANGARVEVTIDKLDTVLKIVDKSTTKDDVLEDLIKKLLDDGEKRRVEDERREREQQQRRDHEQYQAREEREALIRMTIFPVFIDRLGFWFDVMNRKNRASRAHYY